MGTSKIQPEAVNGTDRKECEEGGDKNLILSSRTSQKERELNYSSMIAHDGVEERRHKLLYFLLITVCHVETI